MTNRFFLVTDADGERVATWHEIVDANTDDGDMLAAVASCEIGECVEFGGGAADLVRIQRITRAQAEHHAMMAAEVAADIEAAADEAVNDSPAAWKAREQIDYDGRHTDHE